MRTRTLSPLGHFAEINWFIVTLVGLIGGTGIAMMFSAGGGHLSPWALPQIVHFALACILMMTLAVMPMRMLMDYAYLIYFFCVVVLVVVIVAGHVGKGAERWVRFGGVGLQPSEFMKLAVILALARYFHQMQPEDILRPAFLIVPALILLIPAVLILKQPNLGTTIILVVVGGIMFLMAGIQWRYFIGLGLVGISATPLAWHFMHDYQKRRVLTFLDPQQDPLGAGYNILQSMIAIGSGGFFGKGFMQGTQGQLNFLPEKQTDFIFTMVAEEFGFFGSVILLGLYAMLLISGMLVGLRSRSTFGSMVAVGVTAMIFLHVLINVGMVMGMLPVVGVPLPLLSYGGSITVSTMLAVGLLLNMYMHRDEMPVRMTPRL